MKFQRHIDMLQYIANKGSVTIDELMDTFHISKSTLNRDLNAIEKSGNIERVHGGVVSKVYPDIFEMLIDDKERLHTQRKIAIAKQACTLIEENDTVVIDSGSTMYYFAKELAENKQIKNLTVATNDIKVAYTLCANPEISILMAGGIKHHDGYDLYGHDVSDIVSALNISKYFIAASAFDAEEGITHTNYEDILVKKGFMQCAKEIVLCADSSKDGMRKRFRLCDISQLDYLISDRELDKQREQRYRELGVNVCIAQQ